MAAIILLDDDEQILSVLGEALRKAGHEVHLATDGTAGLRIASGTSVDVLITDIIMPGKEGLETIREIREMHPGIRVIAMSGGGVIGPGNYLDLARALGAHATLRKPFPLADLIDTVDELAGGGG